MLPAVTAAFHFSRAYLARFRPRAAEAMAVAADGSVEAEVAALVAGVSGDAGSVGFADAVSGLAAVGSMGVPGNYCVRCGAL